MSQRRLLLVNDDPQVVSALMRSLDSPIWEIVTASSAEAALQIMASSPCQVVCADRTLPGVRKKGPAASAPRNRRRVSSARLRRGTAGR